MRCLIVDDAATPRQVMEHLVRGAGSLATAVTSGPEALAALAQESYDVALVDNEMPEMNGEETVRALRRASPLLRILVVSAYHDSGRVMAALAAGANGYLLKDEMLGSLVRFVEEVRAGHMPISPRVIAVIMAAHERQLELSEKDAVVGRIARRLIAEIRDPMAMIGEHAAACQTALTTDVLETLEFVYPELDAARVRTSLDVLHLGAGHASAVAHDLGELDRLEDASHCANLAHIADLVTRVLRHVCRGCAQMIVDVPAELRVGMTPSRLGHVLLTLLGHAVETIRERYDGVGTVNLQARARDGWAVVDIVDDGRGLTEIELGRALDPMGGRGSEHRGARLTGCRDMVSRAGGHLILRSQVGEGTCVQLRLPLAAERDEPRHGRRIAMGTGSHGVIREDS